MSEVAGTVWKIEMAVGDPVSTDDVVMILESMKMEIPAVSPASGTIAEILVEEGESISEGQPLFRLG